LIPFSKELLIKKLKKAATDKNELEKQILLNKLKKNTLSLKTYKISKFSKMEIFT